jgi:hypothetical protein
MINSFQPTADAIQEELEYRFQERLGILCGCNEPTRAQWEIAMREIEEFKCLLSKSRKQSTRSLVEITKK